MINDDNTPPNFTNFKKDILHIPDSDISTNQLTEYEYIVRYLSQQGYIVEDGELFEMVVALVTNLKVCENTHKEQMKYE
jgi:hypothetical protein